MNNLNPQTIFLGLIIIATLFEVGGDVVLKYWSLSDKTLLFVSGLAIYFIGTLFWAFSLKYDFLSKAISIIVILNMVIVVLIGAFLFGEQLSLPNKIGIGLGIVSLIMIVL